MNVFPGPIRPYPLKLETVRYVLLCSPASSSAAQHTYSTVQYVQLSSLSSTSNNSPKFVATPHLEISHSS
jgi:hypothetical protein